MRFDIDDYLRHSRRLDLDGIDFDAFRSRPLDDDSLRCIEYMHDVEQHTACYLRDLLMTSAHADPEMTSFLSCWVYEELWHGEALGTVLALHGRASGPERVRAVRRRLGVRDKLNPLLGAVGSAFVGRHLVALHTTWGAINEWTTQAGYVRLAARAGHPVLAELTRRIARQEGRHIDFYASQATRRLDGHPRVQAGVRWALTKLWRPVGSGVMPAAETRFLVNHLFGGDDGLTIGRRLDQRIDRLPGLADLHLIERTITAQAA